MWAPARSQGQGTWVPSASGKMHRGWRCTEMAGGGDVSHSQEEKPRACQKVCEASMEMLTSSKRSSDPQARREALLWVRGWPWALGDDSAGVRGAVPGSLEAASLWVAEPLSSSLTEGLPLSASVTWPEGSREAALLSLPCVTGPPGWFARPVLWRPGLQGPGLRGEEEDHLRPGAVWGGRCGSVGARGSAAEGGGAARRLCGGRGLDRRLGAGGERGRGEPDRDPRALWPERAVLTSPDSETSQQFLVVLAAFASANPSSRRQEAEAPPPPGWPAGLPRPGLSSCRRAGLCFPE
ncbi:uncharacterized protein [Ovis canadensis]|uniref:uncharacterized protein n=1 Tax=Ovis canadensis TaxID=37174 RepID=UPI00375375C8